MKQFVFDIEANGFDPDTVFCVCIHELKNEDTMYQLHQECLKVYQIHQECLKRGRFQDWLDAEGECELIGHNIIGYDIPVLEKLLGADFSKCKITDTLVMSRLANPKQRPL